MKTPLLRLFAVFFPLALVVASIDGFASKAHAAFINTPVPSNAYITLNGYDWAWAYPLPASAGGFDLSVQGQNAPGYGWRIPTAQELALAPLATDFLFPGGNVPFNGVDGGSGATFQAINAAYLAAMSDGAVATPWFSTLYFHADWINGLGQSSVPWAGMPGAPSFADQLVIRNSAPVPEPASMLAWGLLTGVGLVGYRLRRRKVAA